ncbi:MAG: hypothetical protein R3192_05115 [Woeseiaceae bacterium]|nr:hypothetical protein [Woeseiaceae bacterium]
MKLSRLIIAAAIAAPGFVVAQDASNYQCSHGDLKRRVEIVYETGVTVPCEVHYYKDTEAPGERQVLWRALNEEGYCEAKTQEFVTRLGSWGWTCTAAGAAEDAEQAEEADDTEALAPVNEPEDT